MKRGNSPKRRTPLKPGGQLQRKTEMPRGDGFKRTGNPPARKAPKQAKTNRGLDAVKAQARRRDGNTCVVCGVFVGDGGNVHHRRNRGMGGSPAANTISNVVVACGSPTVGCHGLLTVRPWEIDAERYGWVLPTNGNQDPAAVPVLVAWLGWALPLTDGTWEVIDDLEDPMKAPEHSALPVVVCGPWDLLTGGGAVAEVLDRFGHSSCHGLAGARDGLLLCGCGAAICAVEEVA